MGKVRPAGEPEWASI